MSYARLAFFLVVFFLDVHVRASEAAHPPEECWSQPTCAVDAGANFKSLENKTSKLRLAPRAIVERRDGDAVQVLAGTVLAEIGRGVSVRTPFAVLSCVDDCVGIVSREESSVRLKALDGRWLVRRLGEKIDYALDAGLQMTISEVGDKGVAEMEFPQSLPWFSTVKEWAGLFAGTPGEFKEVLRSFRERWRAAVDVVSVIHAGEAGRTIASHQAGVEAEKARQRAREREDRRLRELFRRKNDIYP
ncbi:MAG TPA: hypothetical protein PKC28_14835 [Bdellovibrionales bacterium]|nr:hypothetical protein [Bdellovibrionales bacterium]